MQTDTVSIEQFIQDNGVTIKSIRVDRNPSMPDSRDMDHWKCTLKISSVATGKQLARMTVHFSKGYGHHGAEPTADEVLDCLASDASGYENAQGFEDWCSEYGYDTDSRKAEKIYKAVEHESKRLASFLGDTLYQQLLWNTERM